MLCPSCLKYFKRRDSPQLETVWPVTFQDMKSMGGGEQDNQKNE
jgi:hypothetical protein